MALDLIYPGRKMLLEELKTANKDYYENGLFQVVSTDAPYGVENPLIEITTALSVKTNTGVGNVGISDATGRTAMVTTFGQVATSHKDSQITEHFPYGLPSTGVVSEVTGSGSIETEDSLLKFKTTTADGTAYAESLQALRYIPGSMAYCFFTGVGFPEGVASCNAFIGPYDDEDGFAIGCLDGVPTVLRRRYNGVTADTTYYSQSEWSLDTLDGNGPSLLNVDFTKGQVYSITYGYLGFAPIVYSILSPSGNWIPFHKIEYPNSSAETHISQPYLPLRAEVDNTGSGAAIEIGIGSIDVGIFNGGKTDSSSRSQGVSGDKALATPKSVTAPDYVIALRSKDVYQGRKNKISSVLSALSWATQDSVKSVTLEIIKNPTITTDGTWTDLSTNSSPLEWSIDTVFDINSGVDTGVGFALSKDSDLNVEDIDNSFNVLLRRSEILMVRVNSTNGIVSDLFMAFKDLF